MNSELLIINRNKKIYSFQELPIVEIPSPIRNNDCISKGVILPAIYHFDSADLELFDIAQKLKPDSTCFEPVIRELNLKICRCDLCDKLSSMVNLNNINIIMISDGFDVIYQRTTEPEYTLLFFNNGDLFWLKSSEEIKESEEQVDDDLKVVKILPANSDKFRVYSFLLDSNFMILKSKFEALEIFRHAHNCVVDVLLDLNKSDLSCPKYFIKHYQKLRHNIFAFLFLRSIGCEDLPLQTDVSLNKYIDSNKTPDFIMENEREIQIFEFSVANKYNTLDLVKGGGNVEVKYTTESKLIENKTGKRTTIHIVAAILDTINLEEIKDKILEFQGTFDQDEFIKFFTICNDDRWIINKNQSIIDPSEKKQKVYKNLNVYSRGVKSTTHMVSPDFLIAINNSIETLKKQMYQKTKIQSRTLYFEYNMNSKTIRINQTKKVGYKLMTIEQIAEILEQNNISEIIRNLIILNNRQRVNFSSVRGNMPLTVEDNNDLDFWRDWKESIQITEYYLKKSASYDPGYGDPKKYNISDEIDFYSSHPVAFPPDYKQRIKQLNIEKILNSTTDKILANNVISEDHLSDSIELFNESMIEKNRKIDIKSPKPTFMIPFCTVALSFNEKVNPSFLEEVRKYLNHGYTYEILNKFSNNQFAKVGNDPDSLTSEILANKEAYNDAARAFYDKMRKNFKVLKYNTLNQMQKLTLSLEKNKMNAALTQYKKSLSGTKRISWKNVVKIPCGRKSMQYNSFRNEMTHFNKESKGFKGIGEIEESDYLGFDQYIKTLLFRLTLTKFHNCEYYNLYKKDRIKSHPFLTHLKDLHTERWDNFHNTKFKSTLLEQLVFLTSKLAKSLFNESVKSYNKDYVKIDNLGYDKIILMTRGGAKIYKNQVSRLFRIAFPISEDDLKYTGYLENKNFKTIPYGNSYIILTPWSQIRQDVLFDYMSLPERSFLNLFSSYSRFDPELEKPISRLMLMPSILSFHNRRKTEQFMHNSRYLIVNPLGKYANLKGIITSFADFNYTYLDAWLRKRISKGYYNFANLVSKIPHQRSSLDTLLQENNFRDLWLNEKISSPEQLTTFIYITYMMSKAPVNSSIEQANNLWEILEDVDTFQKEHRDVNGLDDESLRFDITDFNESVYDDDYKYDPVYCQYLGNYISSFFNSVTDRFEIHNEWNRIKNQDIDSIANSNGLRGFNPNNFFNKKGYEVVYDYVNNMMSDQKLNDMIEKYLDSDLMTAQSLVRNDKIELQNKSFEKLVFHIVHKIQRGGGREIFCMDLNTKYLQNPLEKFFKFLCKKVPNEFISIPSNRRHGLIHHDFYEKSPISWAKHIMRWVLDCRRWAPHSVFQKYVHFIEGLSDILPTDMYNYFMDFAEGMFKKTFITRKHVLDKMVNNERFKKYSNYVKKLEHAADAFGFTVQFSFVMGIFNYLSTLLHAANQLSSSEIIREMCLENGHGLVIMDPKCHSDDSVVSSYHEKESSVRLSAILYDWLLKGANHMLSVKKSQINNNVYLEFLSILYLFDRFLPVLPKFASTIPFKPSDKGYSSDLSFGITQSIEMMSQGGSYEESFLIMKLTEQFITKIYNLNQVENMPPQLLGTLDCHPIEFFYAGGNAPIYNALKYDKENFMKKLYLCFISGIINLEESELTLQWDMNARLSDVSKKFLIKYDKIIKSLEEKFPWTLKNCKLGNSSLNLIWYCNKLKDKSFYSSLIDEPSARRFSRIFGAGGYRSIKKLDGTLISINKILAILDSDIEHEVDLNDELNVPGINNWLKFMQHMCRDIDDFHESLSGAKIISQYPSNIKDKPVVFKQGIAKNAGVNLSTHDYIVYVKEPDAYKLLLRNGNPYREVEKITVNLKLMGIEIKEFSTDQLASIVKKYLKEDAREYRVISHVRGDKRVIDSYESVVHTLENNSIKYKTFEIKAPSIYLMDWNRKILSGRVPNNVLKYLNSRAIWDVLNKYSIEDLDIYKKDLKKDINDLEEQLPSEWIPVVKAGEGTGEKKLEDYSYWAHWSKEQVKIGHNWYGSGDCVVKLPETILHLKISNGILTNLEFEDKFKGFLSSTSTWYINSILNLSGFRVDTIPPEFAKENSTYFGYNEKEGKFGINKPGFFTSIIEVSKPEVGILPMFSKINIFWEKRGRYHYGKLYGKEYKVEFFINLSTKPILDFNLYLDENKISNLLKQNNHFITNFVQEMSSQYDNIARYDEKLFFDNIGGSLIFKICINFSKHRDVMQGRDVSEPFLEAILEWKKIRTEFGFPNLEDLKKILEDKNLPPLPAKIHTMLIKAGYSSLSDEDFKNIITKVVFLEEEERERFLVSMFPNLSNDQMGQTLAIMKRSKAIYDSCIILNTRALEIYVPLVLNISETIKEKGIYSPTLDSLVRMFAEEFNINYKSYWIYEVTFTRLCMNAVLKMNITSGNDPLVKLFLTINEELIDSGLLQWLNVMTSEDPLLRTIDFNVDKGKFLNWISDLNDCLYMEKEKEFRPRVIYKSKDIYGLNGVLSHKMGRLRSHAVKMVLNPLLSDKETNVKLKIIKRERDQYGILRRKTEDLFLNKKKSMPGIVHRKFMVLNEDDQDEYECGYLHDDNVIYDLTYEPSEEDVPQYLYTDIAVGSYKGIAAVRGGAHTIIIKTCLLDKSILKVHGNKHFFKKEIKCNNFYEFITEQYQYAVIVTESDCSFEIAGYKKIREFDYMKLLTRSVYDRMSIEIDGEIIDKSQVRIDPKYYSFTALFGNYYRNLSLEVMSNEIEDVDKILKTAEPYIKESEELKKQKEKLKRIFEEKKRKRLKSRNIEEKIQNETDNKDEIINLFNNVIKRFKSEFNLDRTDKNKMINLRDLELESKFYDHRNKFEIITDLRFKAEFETLFPGFWNLYINNEIKMPKNFKNDRITLAKSKIKSMSPDLRLKYNKILLIVRMILESIQESPNVEMTAMSSHFCTRIDYLFDANLDITAEWDEYEGLEEDFDVTLPIKLNFLFDK